jgi:hypothetical protein
MSSSWVIQLAGAMARYNIHDTQTCQQDPRNSVNYRFKVTVKLKGQCHEFCGLCFFYQTTSPGPFMPRIISNYVEYLGNYLYS